jgi:hypothetical protein
MGVWAGDGYWIICRFWGIVEGGTKKGEWEKVWVSRGRDMEATGFCGPYVCLGIFLLLYWKVLVPGIAGDCGCIQLEQ